MNKIVHELSRSKQQVLSFVKDVTSWIRGTRKSSGQIRLQFDVVKCVLSVCSRLVMCDKVAVCLEDRVSIRQSGCRNLDVSSLSLGEMRDRLESRWM